MGKTEMLRFVVDPAVSGMWDQVKGDVHARLGKLTGNGQYLGIVARVYLELQRKDPAALERAVARIRIEGQLDPTSPMVR